MAWRRSGGGGAAVWSGGGGGAVAAERRCGAAVWSGGGGGAAAGAVDGQPTGLGIPAGGVVRRPEWATVGGPPTVIDDPQRANEGAGASMRRA